jgi:hypothetical protein
MTPSPPPQEPDLTAQAREVVISVRQGVTREPRTAINKLVDVHGTAAVRLLRAQANAAVHRDSAWHLARPIYAELAARDRSSRRLLRRADWVCRHADAFDRLFAAHRHQRRVLQRVAKTFPEAVSVEREIGPGGLNTTASYKHRLLDPHGAIRAILFEKVYIGRTPAGFRRVRALHDHTGWSPAFAPAYHGAVRAGPFVSTLHDAIDGSPPPADSWPSVREALLEELCRHPYRPRDSARFAVVAQVRNIVGQLTGFGKVAGTAWRWPLRGADELPAFVTGRQLRSRLSPHLDADQLDRLDAAFKPIKRRLAAQPQFIMHGDLHRTQAHYDTRRSRYVLIDWDRWSLEPLGAGWLPGPDSLTGADTSDGSADWTDGPAIPAALSDLAERQGVAPADAMLAAAMWALRQASTRGDSHNARHYTRLALQLVAE